MSEPIESIDDYMVFLRAEKVDPSQAGGQSVMMIDQDEAVACMLTIHSVRDDLPPDFAGDLATLICLHFNSQ